MAKFMRNYLIKWMDLDTEEEILIGDKDWQKKDGWVYPNLLTINLDVNRNTFAASNECHLQIYNLSRSHRQTMYHDRYRPDKVIYLDIMAGYGQNLSLIFRGKVLQSYSYMQGTNMVTDIQALDIGFMDYIKDGRHVNYSSMTLEEGTSKYEAIKRITTDMEDKVEIGAIGKIGDNEYQTPVSFLGNSIFALDTLTGGHIFVDLGRVNVLSDKEIIAIGELPIIDAETGLLGTPMRRDGQLEVDILFEPSYIVGQGVILKTITGVDEYNGVFKVIGIHHSGTISAANCGSLRTRLNLWYGNRLPQTDTTYVTEEQSFSEVRGEDVIPMADLTPADCRYVYEYKKTIHETPDKQIGDTTINWKDVIKDKDYPKLHEIYDLYSLCITAQEIAGKGKKIKVTSGYRNKTDNANVGGSEKSLHLYGRAIDITRVGSETDLRKIYKIFAPYKNLREVLLEGDCVHLGSIKESFTRGYWDVATKRLRDVI